MSFFREVAHYTGGSRRQYARGLFTGPDPLRLSDELAGRATVSKYMVGSTVVGEVRSTGHEVKIDEPLGVSLLVPLQGRIVSVTNGGTHSASAGSSALIFSPNRRTTRVMAPEDADFLAIPIVIAWSEISRSAELMGVSLKQIRSAAPFSFELSPASQNISDELVGLCRVLHSEVSRGTPRLNIPGANAKWSETISEKVVELLDEANLLHLPQVPWHPTNSRHVNRAMDYMRANAADIVLTAEVAAACGVSSRTLEQAFKTGVGMTPMQVLTSFKLEEARRMLLDRNSAMSVTEVALACGFRHLGRFSGAYSDRFGELPSETRARRQRPEPT